MIAEGYSLYLYCDHTRHAGPRMPPAEFYADDRKSARASARKDGWVFRRDHTVICPACRKMPPETRHGSY